MPIKVEFTDLTDTTIRVFNDSKMQTVSVNFAKQVSNIVLDPDNWILKNAVLDPDVGIDYY